VLIQTQYAHFDTDSQVPFQVVSTCDFFLWHPQFEDGWPYLGFAKDETFNVIGLSGQRGQKGPLWLVKKEHMPWIIGWIWYKHVKRVFVAKGSGGRPDSDALVVGASTTVSQPSSLRPTDSAAETLLTQTSASSISTTTNTSDAQKPMDLAKSKSNSGGNGGEVKIYQRRFEQRSKGDESAGKQVSKTDSAIQSEEVRPTPASIPDPVSQVE